MLTPDVERMAADVLSPDGLPRYVWTDDQPDPTTYTLTLLRAVAERQRWRAQYDQAKAAGAVDSHSATGPPTGIARPEPDLPAARPHPIQAKPGPQGRPSRVSAANPQDRASARPLTGGPKAPLSPLGGGRAPNH